MLKCLKATNKLSEYHFYSLFSFGGLGFVAEVL